MKKTKKEERLKNYRKGCQGVIHMEGVVSVEGGDTALDGFCMNFVATMLFTQQIFHLEHLFVFQLLLIPEIIIISNQISAC